MGVMITNDSGANNNEHTIKMSLHFILMTPYGPWKSWWFYFSQGKI